MKSRDLSTELAIRAQREFRRIVKQRKPWAEPDQLKRGLAFARAWEEAEWEACRSLGYTSSELEMIRAGGSPETAPDDAIRGH